MKLSSAVIALYSVTSVAQAAAIPDLTSISLRDAISDFDFDFTSYPNLFKRKGGGGGGGGRGGGSSSSGSSSSSSGSSSSGSSGSSSGSSGSRGTGGSTYSTTSGRTGSSSSTGGSTSAGSGAARTYGGGAYYGGGAATPYSAGVASPRGISPLYFAAPALGLGFAGGLWAYGAYSYPYHNPYVFHNASRNGTNNESIPVQCWCPRYSECGCDDNEDQNYLNGIVGNGTITNTTLAKVQNLNGTDTLVIDGTLPNGTTAPGGSDDGVTTVSGAVKLGGPGEFSGWWMMLSTVVAIIYLS